MQNTALSFTITSTPETKPKITIIDGEAIENLLTPEDVMRILNIDKTHFRKLVFRGELQKTKVGKLNRFKPSEIRSYIERQSCPR